VKLLATELDRLLWEALTLRDHDWHGRDFKGRLASIRAGTGGPGAAAGGSTFENWGPPVNELYESGPAFALSSNADIAIQARWLEGLHPDYLITYPSNLGALIDHCAAHGVAFGGLREVRTTGETLPPGLRSRCKDVLGVPITDTYSSQECGYLALQCPQSGLYHVMSETVLIEVLDDAGNPCAPGETGELVATVLHNFASPLIRYRLNDHAEVAAPCHCGRGLPTLSRIRGRSRNLVRLPDGTRHWPQVGFYEYREVAPVRQYQMVQHSVREIELCLVVDRPLRVEEERALAGVAQRWLGHPFHVQFSYYATRIPPGPGGKFEDFISLVSDE
jgi:phenylacetate-CoA ligase